MSTEVKQPEQVFDRVIQPRQRLFELNLKEVWRYRELIPLFMKRNFVSTYKQTILGPLWALIQPLFTTVIFTVIFGNLAGLAPSGVPSFIFYLAASIMWGYFSGSVNATSMTFRANAGIMSKVYFPRLIMPITTVATHLLPFLIQFVLFAGFWVYYLIMGQVAPNITVLLLPLLVLQMAALAMGCGIIASSVTTKYRDLDLVVGFVIQLWMYATPVAYDMSIIPDSLMGIYMLNPMTPIINTMRYAFLGVGEFDLFYYLISWAITLVVLFVGILMYNKVERTFADTI